MSNEKAPRKKNIAISGNLDEDAEGRIILRGSIGADYIGLQVDWYQREPGFSIPKIKNMVRAIEAGTISHFPDIILGMRGHKWDSKENEFLLHDAVYIIDGLQRWSAFGVAILESIKKNKPLTVRLGCKVYFGTDVNFEREMFRKFNSGHTSMAPSVIIRNEKEVSRIAGTLFGMTVTEPNFALQNRVCWTQKMERDKGGQLIRGSTLLLIMTTLHTHKLRITACTYALDTIRMLENRIDQVGLNEARRNLIVFFDIVDQLWGIRGQPYGKTHLKQGWLDTLAKVFSMHAEFWKENGTVLFVSQQHMRDLKRIDPEDPELQRLAGANKTARAILYEHFMRHLNHGKQKRLKERRVEDDMDFNGRVGL